MPTFDFAAADAIAPHLLHQAFTDAFADYLIGPFRVGLEHWPQFLARQCADLSLSRVALLAGRPVAFALAAPRPEVGSWRLAMMGALPEARGGGAAAALLGDFIERAAAAGCSVLELECFAQNARALRLYERHGFRAAHALHGYTRPAGQAVPALREPGAREVPLADAFEWLDDALARLRDLPLQVTSRSLRALSVQAGAMRHGSAQVVYSVAAGERVTIHSLLDRTAGGEDGEVLVTTLLHRFERGSFSVPQLQRLDLGGELLERLGFERLPLHQWLMRRELTPA